MGQQRHPKGEERKQHHPKGADRTITLNYLTSLHDTLTTTTTQQEEGEKAAPPAFVSGCKAGKKWSTSFVNELGSSLFSEIQFDNVNVKIQHTDYFLRIVLLRSV